VAELRDVLIYLCRHYPHAHELSKARLTKLVYLADWRSALVRGRQMTSIDWEFSHYGPYVWDVANLARERDEFQVSLTSNPFGDSKEVIAVRADVPDPDLDPEDREILDYVIEKTQPLFWDGFIRLVYSTYPILTRPRFSILDLQALAREYREELNLPEPAEPSAA
jgi:hypothetical protein